MFKLKDLKVKYKNKEIININSFSFPKKGIVVIKGANGSGKTTLFKSMMGMIDYDGDIYFNDINIKEYKEDLYKRICYIDQFGNLISYLTEKENFSLIEELLNNSTNIEYSNRKLNKLSGGQRKKSEEKRLDISSYDAFLLDEPTVSLDKKNKEELINKIKELSNDKLIVIITHELELFDGLATVYDINSLKEDCIINEKKYFLKTVKIKYSFKKIIFNNFIKNIFNFIFMTLTAFSVLALCNFLSYKSSDYNQKMRDNYVFYQIEKKSDVDKSFYDKTKYYEKTNPTRYLDYERTYLKFSFYGGNKKNITSSDVAKVFFDIEGDECKITDALSFHYFGDYFDHKNETIKYINSNNEERVYIISETIDTVFNPNISKDDFDLIAYNCMYIVLPVKEKDLFIVDNFYYVGPAARNNDLISNEYVAYFDNFSLSEATKYVKKQRIYFAISSIGFTIIMFYLYLALNFRMKKGYSDAYKLKTLGVDNKKLIYIFNVPFIIMLISSGFFSLFAYLYLYKINCKLEPNYFRQFGSYINIHFYPIIILFLLLFSFYYIRLLLFKKKLGVDYETRN